VNPDVLKTSIDNGIAVVTLGSANRIFLDQEMTDALTTALEELAGDPGVRVVVLTGGAPGYFIRHYSITSLLRFAEAVRSSGREWADNATYHGGFIDRAIGLCETMAKPTIAAISGTALAGAFELSLACDLRIAQDGEYLIGLPESNIGLLPGAGGTQKLARTIGTPAALAHILLGAPVSPQEAARQGLVHRTVNGKAIDGALEIARRLTALPKESLAYIKRLVRNATETPLEKGLALERNLFMRLCITDEAVARMRSYEGLNITSPARSIEVGPEFRS